MTTRLISSLGPERCRRESEYSVSTVRINGLPRLRHDELLE